VDDNANKAREKTVYSVPSLNVDDEEVERRLQEGTKGLEKRLESIEKAKIIRAETLRMQFTL